MEENTIIDELPPVPCIKCGWLLDINGYCINPECEYPNRKQV